MTSTRRSAAAYEMPNMSATCPTVSMSPVCFFFRIVRIIQRSQRQPLFLLRMLRSVSAWEIVR